ncbi:MAG TPA: PEP-CTERM sorting domain-containing protein [Povalibacter sp.]|nr:PEP-CTERM sorting domain-containing protein [Povalibacter sp.]
MRHIAQSLAALFALSFAALAGAVPITSQQCAPSGDTRTITIDPGLACVAKGSGNNENNAAFQALVADWTFLGKEESGANASLFDASIGQSSGVLTLNAPLWSQFEEILVVLKVGAANGLNLDPDWVVFSLASDNTQYAFSVNPTKGGGLSHASLYGRGSPTSVPEPGTLALLGVGVLGAAAFRRRRLTR